MVYNPFLSSSSPDKITRPESLKKINAGYSPNNTYSSSNTSIYGDIKSIRMLEDQGFALLYIILFVVLFTILFHLAFPYELVSELLIVIFSILTGIFATIIAYNTDIYQNAAIILVAYIVLIIIAIKIPTKVSVYTIAPILLAVGAGANLFMIANKYW